MYTIYLITNSVNGKIYVGKTSSKLRKRWNNHKQQSRRATYGLHLDMRIMGDMFSVCEVTRVDTEPEAFVLESRIIAELDTTNPARGYNATRGSEGIQGFHHSEETKKRLSDINTGKVLSPEHKALISANSKGHKLSDETKTKMSVSAGKRKRNALGQMV